MAVFHAAKTAKEAMKSFLHLCRLGKTKLFSFAILTAFVVKKWIGKAIANFLALSCHLAPGMERGTVGCPDDRLRIYFLQRLHP